MVLGGPLHEFVHAFSANADVLWSHDDGVASHGDSELRFRRDGGGFHRDRFDDEEGELPYCRRVSIKGVIRTSVHCI